MRDEEERGGGLELWDFPCIFFPKKSLYCCNCKTKEESWDIYTIKREEREFLCGGNSKGSPLVFPTNFVSKAEACILLGPKWVHG